MRASYVVSDEYLTPFGRWLAARLFHWEYAKPAWHFDKQSCVFRIYGCKPFYRFCVFDYTTADTGTGRWWRVEIFGLRYVRGDDHAIRRP